MDAKVPDSCKLRHAVAYCEVARCLAGHGANTPGRPALEAISRELVGHVLSGEFGSSLPDMLDKAIKLLDAQGSPRESLQLARNVIGGVDDPNLYALSNDRIHIAQTVVLALSALGKPDNSLAGCTAQIPELASCITIGDARTYVDKLERRVQGMPPLIATDFRALLKPTRNYLDKWFADPAMEPDRHRCPSNNLGASTISPALSAVGTALVLRNSARGAHH